MKYASRNNDFKDITSLIIHVQLITSFDVRTVVLCDRKHDRNEENIKMSKTVELNLHLFIVRV